MTTAVVVEGKEMPRAGTSFGTCLWETPRYSRLAGIGAPALFHSMAVRLVPMPSTPSFYRRRYGRSIPGMLWAFLGKMNIFSVG